MTRSTGTRHNRAGEPASFSPSGAAAAGAVRAGRARAAGAGRMKGPSGGPASEVIREGELEKRSDSLFQLWKKKQVVLSKESLSLFSPEGGGGGGGRARAKELRFGSIQKVDCVERTGKYVYFTIVTTDRKEIDFRCPGESCWNASITMALIDFQNKRAIQDFKSRQEAVEQAAAGSRDRRLARAP
ncbi:pleckstrin homology-like domain family A member 2 [Crotalus tigris]|uniref:pleckstrin homology-like domain family A member 2 n=1 Tax=Crotalus tigris TaxID=88082 RepID=UPI00192F3094|nr:pleckstrin homology-like domain family A member 2 [Crotalus tigris]